MGLGSFALIDRIETGELSHKMLTRAVGYRGVTEAKHEPNEQGS